GVEDIKDLKPGMVLEGTVTNVAAFGAFVDIGVHQDGLVHVSQLADRFVKDPHEVVKAGDVVKVRVTEVDVPRKRIGLSMRKDGGASAREDKALHGDGGKPGPQGKPGARPMSSGPAPSQGAFGAALMDALKKR
ncbi:MAG: S1 RNA-binding domain-containing protein, partial [Rhodobacteraceae bacterium]|nr:S1 RNA-binding domain-containing protein [Paracoccaceae bacterium]